MTIVLVSHGKGNDRPDSFSVRLFAEKNAALDYIERVSHPEEKYWTVAEIVEDGEGVEPLREGFAASGTSDWIEA